MNDTNDARLLPDGVLEVVRLAVHEDLLSNVESLASGLTRSEWVRAVEPGLWRHPTDSNWIIVSSGHAPNASVFLSASDEAVLGARAQLRDDLDGGAVREVQRTTEDADWTIWTGGEVVISLNAETARRSEGRVVPAILQLAVERSDTPSEGLPSDPARARRIARTGSVLQRWYLAAERDLPHDVVAQLRVDHDPVVSAAINAAQPPSH